MKTLEEIRAETLNAGIDFVWPDGKRELGANYTLIPLDDYNHEEGQPYIIPQGTHWKEAFRFIGYELVRMPGPLPPGESGYITMEEQ